MGDFDLNFKKSAIIPITAEVISKRGFVVLYSTGSTLRGYLKYLYAHNAQTNDNIMQTIQINIVPVEDYRNWYVIYQIALFTMTASDPERSFLQLLNTSSWPISLNLQHISPTKLMQRSPELPFSLTRSKRSTFQGQVWSHQLLIHSYNGRLIGNCM